MLNNPLYSERIYCKILCQDHVSEKYLGWLNSSETNKYLQTSGNQTLESLQKYVYDQSNDNNSISWGIHLISNNNHIGNVKIHNINLINKSCEFGILIGDRNYWNKGYGFEITARIIEFAFSYLQLKVINLGAHKENLNAIKLYQKFGFKFCKNFNFSKNDDSNVYMSLTNYNFSHKIILGSAQFGMKYGIANSVGDFSQSSVSDILDKAIKNNISYLDSAEAYGNSLKNIGIYHKRNINNRFKIISKLNLNNFENNTIENHILNQIKICGIQNLYGYMFHNFDDMLNNLNLLEKMISLREKKIITNIGVSLYTESQIEKILTNFTNKINFIQVPFNILDNSKSKVQLLEELQSKGVFIHARSIFLQGLFVTENQKVFSENLIPIKNVINSVKKKCDDFKISINELALNYVLSRPYINKIIFGVDNVNQLSENLSLISKNRFINFDFLSNLKFKNRDLLNPNNW